MTKRLAIALLLAGCSGGTTEPVTVTTATTDGVTLATHVGTVPVPDDAYRPIEGCTLGNVQPYPPALADDLDALAEASDCESPETVVSVVIGDYHATAFGGPFVRGGRVDFYGAYRVAADDEAGSAALEDLIARIH